MLFIILTSPWWESFPDSTTCRFRLPTCIDPIQVYCNIGPPQAHLGFPWISADTKLCALSFGFLNYAAHLQADAFNTGVNFLLQPVFMSYSPGNRGANTARTCGSSMRSTSRREPMTICCAQSVNNSKSSLAFLFPKAPADLCSCIWSGTWAVCLERMWFAKPLGELTYCTQPLKAWLGRNWLSMRYFTSSTDGCCSSWG